jgi:hypothetical protein
MCADLDRGLFGRHQGCLNIRDVSERLSRGDLLRRATLLAGSAALADLPGALRMHGWLEDAQAAGPSLVEQTWVEHTLPVQTAL